MKRVRNELGSGGHENGQKFTREKYNELKKKKKIKPLTPFARAVDLIAVADRHETENGDL